MLHTPSSVFNTMKFCDTSYLEEHSDPNVSDEDNSKTW